MRRRIREGFRDTVRSLHFRNFRLFFGGQFISQIGNWLTMITQALLVLHLTDNNGIAVGVLTACQFLPVLVLGAWTGLVADRSDKRKLLLIVQTFAMFQSFGLAVLVFTGNPPILALYGIALVGGVATAFDNPARRAFVVEMVPETHVQNAVSLNTALMTGSRVIGPALAGLLVVTVGYAWCFALDGVSYLAVLYGLWRMNPAELRASTPTPHAKGQVRAGLRYARSVPELWVPLTMMAMVGTFAFNFSVVMPLFAKLSLDGSDSTFTILFSVVSIGSVVGALVTARRRTVQTRDVVRAAGLFGISLLAMAASPTLITSFPAAVFLGFASVVFMTASTAIVQLRAAPEMRGRVLALQAIVFLGSTPIGGPIIGAICEEFGARTGFVVGGVACFVAAAWGAAAVRRGAATPPLDAAQGATDEAGHLAASI
jgi:MFS family permease